MQNQYLLPSPDSLRGPVTGISDQSNSGKKENSTENTINHDLFEVAGTAAIHKIDAGQDQANNANQG